MYDAFIDTLETIPRGLVYVALGLAILILAKYARDIVTRSYRIDEQITKSRNLAVSLRFSGYLMGVVLVFLGALYQPLLVSAEEGFGFNRDFGEDVLKVFLYSLAGIVALNIVRIIVNRLVLYKFDIEKQIVEGQNVGAGAVEFGTYIATGLLIGGAASGEGGGPETALAFFGMGLVVLILFALVYQLTTPFDIHKEIEGDNTAVGIALGSNLIAMGLVTFKAVFGNFNGWNDALASFFVFVVIGFVLLFVLRLLIDVLLLPTAKISKELAAERNVGVAFVESSIVISSALILFFAI